VEWAASNWFFQHRQYDLAVVAAIVSDRRFVSYRRQVSDQVRANYEYLRRELAPPLAVQGPGGGCFCLIDAAGLGTDDVSYAALLRDRYQALVVPVSWFPAGQAARETRVRVSLNRSGEVIAALAEVLNASAASAGKLAS